MKTSFTVGITSCYVTDCILDTIKSIKRTYNGDFPFILIADSHKVSPKLKKELKKLKVRLTENKFKSSIYVKQKQILNLVKTKYVLLTRDDVLFDKNTIQKVVYEFSKDPLLTFVGVKNTPLPGKNSFEKAVNIGTLLNNSIAQKWNNGDNYLSMLGRLMAFKTSELKKLDIHESSVSLDAYAYFENKRLGGKYKCIWNTNLYFRNPQNIKEHLRKSSRFQNSHLEMEGYEKFENLKYEYNIPLKIIIKAAFEVFLKNPVSFLYYIPIFVFTRVFKINPKISLTSQWLPDISTKNLEISG